MKLSHWSFCKNKLLLGMASSLASLGLGSLIISKLVPTTLLNGVVSTRPLPLCLTLVRAWFYSDTDTTSFLIALQLFAFWCLSSSAIIFIYINFFQKFFLKPAKKINQKYILTLLLLGIFAISVGVRLQTLNRSLGVRNQILTADAIVAMRVWKERKVSDHYFIRNHTFTNSADHNIPVSCGAFTNNGDCFYVSYPPFGIIMPYFLFWLLGLEPTQLNLQLFNLSLHFISALLVYLIIKILTIKTSREESKIAALIGYSFFVFAPLAMVIHTDAYLSEMAIQPFWLGGIYFFLRLVLTEKNKIFDFTLFGICIFLAAYTEWLGFLLAGTAGLYAIINWQKPWSKKILLISFLGASSALALTLGQMHLALGLKTALEALRTKFLVRTGIEASTEYSRFSPYAWFKIILNYLRGYDFILIATLIAIITLLRKKWTMLTSWLKSTAATPLLTFLFIAGLPVCLHHALLFQWTAVHPFSPLKMAPLITVLAGLCFAYIITHTLQRVKVNTAWKYTIFFIVAFSVFSFLSKTSFCSSDYERRSSFIRNLSKQNEVIFRKQIDKEIEPFLISKRVFYALYSGRNVSIWDNLKNAKQLLQKNGVSDGILFEMNAADPTSLKYVRFNLQSTEEDLEAGFNRFNH